jgi:hypothetical protein
MPRFRFHSRKASVILSSKAGVRGIYSLIRQRSLAMAFTRTLTIIFRDPCSTLAIRHVPSTTRTVTAVSGCTIVRPPVSRITMLLKRRRSVRTRTATVSLTYRSHWRTWIIDVRQRLTTKPQHSSSHPAEASKSFSALAAAHQTFSPRWEKSLMSLRQPEQSRRSCWQTRKISR